MTFQDLVKQLENHGGQQTIAEKLGVTSATVSRWASGKAQPKFEHCLGLARHYRLDPIEVIETVPESNHWVDLYNYFFSNFTTPEIDESDLYGERDSEWHRLLQRMLDDPKSREAIKKNLEAFSTMLF